MFAEPLEWRVVRSKSLTISALPLPLKDKPADFQEVVGVTSWRRH